MKDEKKEAPKQPPLPQPPVRPRPDEGSKTWDRGFPPPRRPSEDVKKG
jgi:hypothetical protein